MASQGKKSDLDEYEDEKKVYKYISKIQFHPFISWRKSAAWEYELPKDEIPETVAAGVNWCAVSTDANYI